MARYDVSGKVALITGGGRGIGLGIAQALVARGAKVALVDLHHEIAVDAAHRLGHEHALGLHADVTDASAIQTAVHATVQQFGGIDIVVANAGVAPNPPAPMRVMPAAEFERVVEIDLLGVYRTITASIDQIVARQGMAVLVSSVYAFGNGMLNSPYAVAKAGVEQLGRALRVELAIHDAHAMVAYFGFVDTQMVRDAFEQSRQRSGREPGEILPAWLLKRITPEEAGEAVARAIERRRARVIAPWWWTIGSVLRGIINPPLDYLATKQPRILDGLRDAEAGAGGASGSTVAGSDRGAPEPQAAVPPRA